VSRSATSSTSTDAGEAIAHVATAISRDAVNIGSGAPARVRDLVATIGRILGAEDRIDYGAIRPARTIRRGLANVDRLTRTGWRPRLDLEAGLRDRSISRAPKLDT